MRPDCRHFQLTAGGQACTPTALHGVSTDSGGVSGAVSVLRAGTADVAVEGLAARRAGPGTIAAVSAATTPPAAGAVRVADRHRGPPSLLGQLNIELVARNGQPTSGRSSRRLHEPSSARLRSAERTSSELGPRRPRGGRVTGDDALALLIRAGNHVDDSLLERGDVTVCIRSESSPSMSVVASGVARMRLLSLR